ncbi:unnamed protein product [Blumeria hordei]|uniref:Uncharacterized protein n=1 Tax=Blumeria hordei TaxID=2867405 RepID=A0A383V107_BLUHO|nr:unnamed protein product [Blumeria hordei]
MGVIGDISLSDLNKGCYTTAHCILTKTKGTFGIEANKVDKSWWSYVHFACDNIF